MDNQQFNNLYWSKRIFYILENFDFEKVHHVMTLLNWKWMNNNKLEVPSITELKNRAVDMMWGIVESDNLSVSSGGFRVDISHLYGEIELSFVVETVCECLDEE